MRQKKVRKPRLIVWAASRMRVTGRALKEQLAQHLPNYRVLLVRPDSQTFKLRDTDTILNWGATHAPVSNDGDFYGFNLPNNVKIAANKLLTFQQLATDKNINQLDWTTDPDIARCWVRDDGELVVARTVLTGNSGEGIVLCDDEDTIEALHAPLYVKYKKKRKEFRVHVFHSQVIDVTEKRKQRDYEGEVNTKIRNHGNGWVFCREDLDIPHDLYEQALWAVDCLGLDFGAVDIIWNQREDKSYVLEVNTAPGLEGTTLNNYVQAIIRGLE